MSTHLLWPWLLSLFLLVLLGLFGPGRYVLAEGDSEAPDDDTLVRQAQAGDRHAFNRLVGRHQTLMYNIALRVLGDSDRAADATQDAFVSAYRKIDQYSGGHFRAWMARIVKNQCYDLIRYEKRRPATSLEALLLASSGGAESRPDPAGEHSAPERPDDATLRHEVASWLQEVILHLPIDQRLTLVMSDVHGYSYEEIAAATEVELGTVKSRLSRARRRVRELLQEQSELLPEQYRF
ncbi:MAG: sigma-70 family RNA polymerase sigma factor [Ardenticatenales bacterium]|nr:sigma-70 family RNA polymerase sigma factor [Ardenticatenales bacterium]